MLLFDSNIAGSDGKLYNNKCLAECQQGVTATDARPDASRSCPPAFAANGGRRLQSTSSADQAGRACPCPRIYRPVCGEFSTLCQLVTVLLRHKLAWQLFAGSTRSTSPCP
jgi:hypothetical protein